MPKQKSDQSSTTPEVTTESAPAPRERILVSPQPGGYRTFFRKTNIGKTADGFAYKEFEDILLELRPCPIEGLPPSAGGCALVVNDQLARDLDTTFEELVQDLMDRKAYGVNIVFLDDEENRERIISRMVATARQDEEAQREAQMEGVLRSDLLFTEDKVRLARG